MIPTATAMAGTGPAANATRNAIPTAVDSVRIEYIHREATVPREFRTRRDVRGIRSGIGLHRAPTISVRSAASTTARSGTEVVTASPD